MLGEVHHGRLALLVEDPDLALGIPDEEHAVAERVVTVPFLEVEQGPLVLGDQIEEPLLGVLLLRGFVGVEVALGGRSVEQMLGPGDVIRPLVTTADTLPATFTHRVVQPARLAVLDERFIAAARRWPGLLLALHERLGLQERQLFVNAAASKQRRAEDRLLAVLWQLADQWGRVTADGVVLPIHVSHAMLGRLTGSQRPTVTLALASLAQDGHLRRAADDRMVLAPDSWRVLDPNRAARPRTAPAVPAARGIDQVALLKRVAALQASFEDRVRDVDQILAASRVASDRNMETRRRLRDRRDATAA